MPPQSEAIKRQIDQLSPEQLQQVADFIAFLKFRSRPSRLDPTQLAALLSEQSEDRALAEAGMNDYATLLQQEDQQ
ncbi:MAG: hypothetical protein ACKO7W_18455 [Elainella sp.]